MINNVDFLNIPKVVTTKVHKVIDFEKPTTQSIEAKLIATPYTCGRVDCCGSFVGHGVWRSRIKDTPVFGRPAVINLSMPRYKCKSAGHTFSLQPSEISFKHLVTIRAFEYVGFQALSRTVSEISTDTGISRSVILKSFDNIVMLMDCFYKQKAPETLGIDEAHLGGKYKAVFTDLDKNQVIDINESRSKDTIKKVISSFHGFENIKYVSMDMCEAYRDAVKEVIPNATIVIDKRHVLEYARKAMDEERKKIWRKIKNKKNNPIKNNLKRIRQLLNSRKDKLKGDEIEEMKQLLSHYPALLQSYEQKERFNGIWAASNSKQARALYKNWKENIPDKLTSTFAAVANLFKDWGDYIFSYFDTKDRIIKKRITNAYTESANRIIKEIYRRGRGNNEFWRFRAKVLHKLGPWTEREIRDTIGVEHTLILHYDLSFFEAIFGKITESHK